jgi:NAD(P)-dependent dehydrogenase (short-subunit alcohol dehydrogenase family)
MIANLTPEKINNVIFTNLIGPINVCRIAAKYMIKGGHIVSVGSSSAYRGRTGYAVYSASKAALANFSQAAADEFSRFGIHVNVVSPPRTDTRLIRSVYPDADPDTLFDPKDAARVICSYCTGTETGNVVDLKLHLAGYGIGSTSSNK